MLCSFDEFEFDTELLELRCAGEVIAAQPMVLELLALLLINRDKLLRKDDLIESLWGGRIVSAAAISGRIAALRDVLGDNGSDQRLIQTVYGRGFRFVGNVTVDEATSGVPARAIATQEELPAKQLSTRPSIAVLPFALKGMDGIDSGLSDGFSDDLITALSRLRWISVTARGSSFRFPSFEHRLDTIARELGVRYCLSGSIEIGGERVTISVELATTDTEAIIWSDRFSERLAGIQDLRDEVVLQTLSRVEADISAHEAARARLKNVSELSAWESFHMGLTYVSTRSGADLLGGLQWFERAIGLEPRFARAHAGIAYIHWFGALQATIDDRPVHVSAMMKSIGTAMDCDPLDPFVNATAGRASGASGNLERAIELYERAITASPSYSLAYGALAGSQAAAGFFEAAIANNETAMRLNPLDPLLHHRQGAQITALLGLQDFEAAAEWAEKSHAIDHSDVPILVAEMTAFHCVGRERKAAEVAQIMGRAVPGISAQAFDEKYPFLHESLREISHDAFRANAKYLNAKG